LHGAKRVGVTAGASTPNWLIDQVVKRLRDFGSQGNGNGAGVN
jgi:4-hydroxy-3-methylbut-2-enyl diphosphate reductase